MLQLHRTRGRYSRRVLTLVGLTTTAVAAGGSLAASVAPRSDAAPATAGATITSQPQLGAKNVAGEKAMAWHRFGDWISQGTLSGPDLEPPTPCMTRTLEAYAGARRRSYRRDFQLRGSDQDYASALATQFHTTQQATNAAQAVRSALADCRTTLRRDGYQQVSRATTLPVTIASGSATFTEISYDIDLADDEVTFAAIGVIRSAKRVEVISMTVHGQDNNWSYVKNDPTELPLHPMFATLPAAARQLNR